MASNNRFSKPVAFNKTSKEDQTILKHMEGRNFSGYVKQLILADIQATQTPKAENKPIQTGKKGIKYILKN